MKIESGFIKTGNTQLYYELSGVGQPLVMIHAGVADSRLWNYEFEYLSQAYRVLRYDMRGYGKSQPAEGEYSNLGDLIAVLDHLRLQEPLIMVGCSMGGGLAMDFALAYPARVKALVMVDSGPSGLDLDVPDHPAEAAAEEAYKAGDFDLLAELEAQIWFDGMGRTPDQVNQEKRAMAVEMNRLALGHEAKGLGKRLPDATDPAAGRLAELCIPVLVLLGEHDIPYMHAAADYMVENIAAARKVIIQDAAHLPNLDHPDNFQAALLSFLEEIKP